MPIMAIVNPEKSYLNMQMIQISKFLEKQKMKSKSICFNPQTCEHTFAATGSSC